MSETLDPPRTAASADIDGTAVGTAAAPRADERPVAVAVAADLPGAAAPGKDVGLPLPARRPGRAREFGTFLRHRPGLALSLAFVVFVLVAAVAPGIVAPGDPLTGEPAAKLQGPSAEHLFGTDQLGRDVFTRVVHGTSLSLRATALAVVVALVLGASLGLAAGFVGGVVDDVVMRLVDVLQAIPRLLLSLAVITALGFGTTKVAFAVGLASAAGFARVMRAEVLRVRSAGYVEAAHACGVRPSGVLLRHILPNSWGPVLVMAALEFGVAILAVSSLSFLGFGATPPTPEWGSLVSEGRNYVATAWWLTAFPGLVIAATVLAANRVSRALDAERGDDR
ncbi:ABC transporter permease [Streptomycetaceae bacterium NBC_01309]